MKRYDVVIIGGGFYGASAAHQLAHDYPDLSFMMVEKERRLFSQAAETNFGQLHMGYLYSALPKMANVCSRDASLFMEHFGSVVDQGTKTYYGIHQNSSVSPDAYRRFCDKQGLTLKPHSGHSELFGKEIAESFLTDEKTFNSSKLQQLTNAKLSEARNLDITLDCNVTRLAQNLSGYTVSTEHHGQILATAVINAAFAGVNNIHNASNLPMLPIRHDLVLHFIVELPVEYEHVGAWVISGRYALLAPSSFRGAHIFAPSGYRDVATSIDGLPPRNKLDNRQIRDLYTKGLRDASVWIPVLKEARYLGHTLGLSAKSLDLETGRHLPITTIKVDYAGLKNYHLILGGKIGSIARCITDLRRINLRVR